MGNMNDSMAYPGDALAHQELPGWKTVLGNLSAVLIAALFLIAGVWKITDAPGAAVRMAQFRIPQDLSLLTAISFGIAETFAAVLILVPRFRRWGSWLISAMLVAFMIYVAYNYSALQGEECSCFPWIKRAIGPGFFVFDGALLLLSVLAGVWARPSEGKRNAILILSAVSVFALVSYGVAAMRVQGVKAPASITVDGQPYSLERGKVVIYFFDPECSHCLDAARRLAKLNWGDTKVVAVPTVNPQFGQSFLQTTGLKAGLSNDLELLKRTFPFGDPPAGAALEDGRQKAALTKFEGDEPAATLKKLGFVE